MTDGLVKLYSNLIHRSRIDALEERMLAKLANIESKIITTTDQLREGLQQQKVALGMAASSSSAARKGEEAQVPAVPPVARPAAVVRVGVGVVVRRAIDGRILVGVRKGSHGANKVAFPGGHLEMNESWDECARREVEEETGLSITKPTRHVATTNDPMPAEGKHYITIFMEAEAPADVEPQNLEPHKCLGWEWMSWSEIKALPDERLFIPFRHFLSENPELYATTE